MSDPKDRYEDDEDDDESERWDLVEEMEREVEEDGGDPVDLYDFD